MKVLHDLVQGLAESWLLVFAILVTITAVVLYLRSRKQILFESWINMYDSTDSDTGRSVGDLLLFKIGFIKNVHERSAATYEPDYPEGANDLAALLLEPGYAGRNVPEALRYHHEALELLREPEQENQRKKLCALFSDRWRRLPAEEAARTIASSSGGEALPESHCSCPALLAAALKMAVANRPSNVDA